MLAVLFYGMSTPVRLFNIKVSFFVSSSYMVSNNQFFLNTNNLFAHKVNLEILAINVYFTHVS